MRKQGVGKRLLGAGLCLTLLIGCAGCAGSSQSGRSDGTEADKAASGGTLTGDDHSGTYGSARAVAAYDTAKTNYALSIDAGEPLHEISDTLYGIFIEDINFAADGGLYAELVQNRSFEFTSLASNNEKHAWTDVGAIDAQVITGDADGALNANNPNYMRLKNGSAEPAGIENRGFLDGMAIGENAAYDFSIYARGVDGYTGPLYAALTVDDEVVAEEKIAALTEEWTKYELTLTSPQEASKNVKLRVTIDRGSADVDMVSLFPQDTYRGRKNGLRKDLAEKLEALSPAFLRFPGGCVVEGVTLDKAYDWKDSIGVGADGEPLEFGGTYGDVAARPMGQNIWTNENATEDAYPSYMTYGLGFYEYFLLAEDLGAVGVPVVNCGLCCMAQGNGSGPAVGTPEHQAYVQDALDLVEFCRGDAATKWGAVRVAMGHEEPFALKYIGIGNEQWGSNFFSHYRAFVDAFAGARESDPEMYGDIELIFTAGVDDGDSGHAMYMDAYNYAKSWLDANADADITEFAGMIDHHYYNTPEWFLEHADYYDEDNYGRNAADMTRSAYAGGIPVFLGEYAAQSNNLKAALAEAAYMTGLERNGDIVRMAAYAPLFGNPTATHWSPDLIWFNNHQVSCSVNYYVQQVFAQNAGTQLFASTLEGAEDTSGNTLGGRVGVGTWNTAASFGHVKVIDNETEEVLAEDDFSGDSLSDWEKVSDGAWSISDGALVQASESTNTSSFDRTGTAAYFGDDAWTDYTYTVEATKTAGQEGFLIPFSVQDANNNYFWNIGGWGNTVSCLQTVKDGVKSDQVGGTVRDCVIETGKTYQLKVVVRATNVKCYIDDELYVDYNVSDSAQSEAYQVVSTDASGDIIIKLVNEKNDAKTFAIDIANAGELAEEADAQIVAGDSIISENVLGREEAVTPETVTLSGVGSRFNYTADPYSVTVLRLHRK